MKWLPMDSRKQACVSDKIRCKGQDMQALDAEIATKKKAAITWGTEGGRKVERGLKSTSIMKEEGNREVQQKS